MILNSEIHMVFMLPQGLQEQIDKAFKLVTSASQQRRFRLTKAQRTMLMQEIAKVSVERQGEALSIADICGMLYDNSAELASWGKTRLHRFVKQRLKPHYKSGFEQMDEWSGKHRLFRAIGAGGSSLDGRGNGASAREDSDDEDDRGGDEEDEEDEEEDDDQGEVVAEDDL